MHNRVQTQARLLIIEHDTRQGGAVEAAVLIEQMLTELRDRAGKHRLAGLHEGAGDSVRIHQECALLNEEGGDGALAAADTAGESVTAQDSGGGGRRLGHGRCS